MVKDKNTQNRRVRILVVEDNPSLRKSVARMLGLEHEVITAVDGQEALELLSEDDAFDAVLSDMDMPRVNGFEFWNILREDHPHLADRLVFWSGGIHEALEATGRPLLVKPVDPAQLLEVVELLIRPTHDAA